MNAPAPRESAIGPPAPETAAPHADPAVVPWGYRPGIITAVTVFLAFSLAFLRYWGFEAPGRWRWISVFRDYAIQCG